MKRLQRIFLLVVVVASAATSIHAQRPRDPVGGRPLGPQREELERRFRERSAEIVRRQLQLNDAQMTRLQTVNQQFERQRIALLGEERQARQALRAELTSTTPNQQKVSSLLDQLMGVQRRRFDIVAGEQRELAKFLTPVQRAKYLGLQNQLRQRMEQLQRRGGARDGRRVPPMRRPGPRRDLPY